MITGWIPDYPITTLVLLAAVALVAGMARGFSGFGAALIFVPSAAALVGPKLASPMLAVIDGVLAANIILFFAASGAFSLASYFWSGLISRETLHPSLLAGPGYGAGICFGTRMFGLGNPAVFRAISFMLIALAALLSLPVFG